ncbi:MAG: AAA family ATPase, partial [Acidobacteriota bacterium]
PPGSMSSMRRTRSAIGASGTTEQQQERLETTLDTFQLDLGSELVLNLAQLLGLASGRMSTDDSPERQRRRMLEAFLTLLLGAAEDRPTVLVVEDLHWVDPTTLEALGLLIEHGAAVRLFLFLTFRSYFQPPWQHRSHVTQLSLGHLSTTEARDLIDRLAGDQYLPAAVIEEIVDRTDGVPLFIEEMTKTVLETAEPLTDSDTDKIRFEVPATLRDSMTARLDRLGAAKEVAQLAAVIGREFSYALLAEVAPIERGLLDDALDQLVQAELIYRKGFGSAKTTYFFKHALIRDAAYQLLLASRRRQIHARVAEVLEASFPELTEQEPELLAHHLAAARLFRPAVLYRLAAGRRAAAGSAHPESLGHYRAALELLDQLPANSERVPLDVEARLGLGAALIATQGYGAEEAEQVFEQAAEACKELGDTPLRFAALGGLWMTHHMRGDYDKALDDGDALLAGAEKANDATMLAVAHAVRGWSYFNLARLSDAHSEAGRVIALYRPDEHHPQIKALFGHDYGLWGLNVQVWIHLYSGRLDQAVRTGEHALDVVRRLTDPGGHCLALSMVGAMWGELLDIERCGELIDEMCAVAAHNEWPWWLVMARASDAWVRMKRRPTLDDARQDELIRDILGAIEFARSIGQKEAIPTWSDFAAETYLYFGNTDAAFAILEDAFAITETGVDRFKNPALLRLRAQAHYLSGNHDKAHADLLAAIEEARRDGSHLYALRAAMALVSLTREADVDPTLALQLLTDSRAAMTGDPALPVLREADTLLAG